MNQNINEIEINGVKYVPKGAENSNCLPLSDAVLIRCESAGVFYGNLASYDTKTGTAQLQNARRVWYWVGASSLSQLAVDGTSKPNDCKFPTAVSSIQLAKVIEVIPLTAKALASLNSVKVWKQ